MGKWVKSLIIGLVTTPMISLICCNRDDRSSSKTTGEEHTTNIQPPLSKSKSIPTIKSDDHVLVFIDKSNSIDPAKRPKFTNEQGVKIIEFLESNGGSLTIFFIHKNLASASHYFEQNFAKPDISDMVEFKAKTNLNKFKTNLDSITYFVNTAINDNANSSNSNETDMWITIKKINDKFSQKPPTAKLHVVYLSDMIEAVVSSKCGKNYTGKKISTVDIAQNLAATDYPLFEKCFNIKSLPKNLSVMMYFPTDANPDKDYSNYPEYWKSLFAKFGVKTVNSNI